MMDIQMPGPVTIGTVTMPRTDTSNLYLSRTGYAAVMDWYARRLAGLPFACASVMLPTRYGGTHALACGPEEAPPVVLLHGTEGTALSWRLQMAALRERFRVYSVDILGANGRSAPMRLPWTGRAYGEWLADVLDALGLESAAFAGISNGAWHIVRLALVAPRRVGRAVLVSAHGMAPVRPPFNLARFGVVNVLRARVLAPMTRRWMIERAVAGATPRGVAIDPDEVESLYLLARHYRFRYPPELLTDEELRALDAPALLLMGRHDPFFDAQAVVARARRTLPNLRDAEVLAGAGHNLLTNRPDEVSARMLAFLAE